jgi:hypothetical protein
MDNYQHNTGRKKFLLWSVTAAAVLAVSRLLPRRKKISCAPPVETVKMLTQDGRLVEINKNLLASSGKKITNEELQQWINPQSPKP